MATTTGDDNLISWLLAGDVSIRYQAQRDLLGADEPTLTSLQRRIGQEGWGARFLALQNANGHWGMGFYQPKWTCTHYTLLDLQALGLSQADPQARRSVQMVFDTSVMPDGSINFARTDRPSDVCINGMALNYASYFRSSDPKLHGVVDYLLRAEMPDGGWNCRRVRGAVHSSLHTTISVLEGLYQYRMALGQDVDEGTARRIDGIRQAEARAREFMLQHRLFMSDKTGAVIKPEFLKLAYPPRWHYDILRCLDYLAAAGVPYDERMEPAMSVLAEKRRPDGPWPLQSGYQGNVHFSMEKVGQPSRWNTLRALRVKQRYAPGEAPRCMIGATD